MKRQILVITGGSIEDHSIATNITKLTLVLKQIFNDIYLVTRCNEENIKILPTTHIFTLSKNKNNIIEFFLSQLKITKAIFIMNKRLNFDTILFTFGKDLEILPIIFSKILRKKIIIRSDGRSTTIMAKDLKEKKYFKWLFFKIVEEINYSIADRILVECDYAIKKFDFQKYKKTSRGNLFIDTTKFFQINKMEDRTYDIGYIGRFSEEKGIILFMETIQNIAKIKPDVKILIAGEGNLSHNISQIIKEKNLCESVTLLGWIPHEKLPCYLNDVKILVLPSLREGLPNIILEALGCGTVVVATPVGSIPGVIKNNNTGFIIQNNTPDGISNSILHALNHSDLSSIIENANTVVNNTYSFNATVNQFQIVFKAHKKNE